MKVYYMNGAGNDFMVIDARGLTLDFEKLSLGLCKLSGADGFMAVDDSEIADFKLHFYNADGSRGEMCGNGSIIYIISIRKHTLFRLLNLEASSFFNSDIGDYYSCC